jgi:hypothetical protein
LPIRLRGIPDKLAVLEEIVQASVLDPDRDPSQKRRRTMHRPKPKEPRSKSAGHLHSRYKSGRGAVKIDHCNADEARRVLDEHWLPPDLPGMGRKSSLYLSQPVGTLSEEDNCDYTQRRHSESSSAGLPLTPTSLTSSSAFREEIRMFRLTSSIGRAPPTPSASRGSSESSENNKTLEDSLGGLFLDETDKGFKELTLSSSKGAELEEKRKERIRREKEAAAKARKERRLGRQYPLKPLVSELSPEWEEIVSRTEAIRDDDMIITKGSEGTPISGKDFKRLLGRQAWLNDEIVNAYLEWVVIAANAMAAEEAKAHGDPASTVPKFITHNSFFLQTLRNKGAKATERLMKRKKAPGVSLMEVDSVFVPICSGNHWTIGVVRPVAKTIEYFDSMGGRSQDFVKLMREWLSFQLGKLYKEEEWTIPRTGCAHQSNGWDCGVFVCTNALCVAMGLDTSCYYERDMTQQRRNIAAVLINKGFNGELAWERAGLLPQIY